jgi:hypothetical protein
MKSNPIFKKIIRRSYDFSLGTFNCRKEWVAKCTKCDKIITAGKSMGLYGIIENSRKVAKDALYRHTLMNH